jgi:hypothetical protein
MDRRLSGWKGPNLMMDFHAQQLMKENYITILEGLEASIGWAGILYEKGDNKNGKPFYEDNEIVNYFRPRKELDEVKFTEDLYGKETPGAGAYLYPPYTNVDCMKRMAKSAFGSDLYHLKAHMYGNNIENCHAEVIASGTIPIFHKHFCDNVIHRVTGNSITEDSGCSGTIGLDHTNFDETRELMVKLSNDPVMRDEWREMAFTYWRKHSNANTCASEIIENLENIVLENGVLGAQESPKETVDVNQLSIFDEIENTQDETPTPTKDDSIDLSKNKDSKEIDYDSLLNDLKNL